MLYQRKNRKGVMKMPNIQVTAVAIQKGVIRVIEPNGLLRDYAQRGLSKYSDEMKLKSLREGIITQYTLTLRELPKNYSISFECPEIQGRAYATFNPKRK